MLGLNSNDITDEGARYLAEMLKTNKILTFLRLSHNSISDQGVQLLADTLTHHNNMVSNYSSNL
jgi:Ran GTPase-activating protein (RanGAP) involved in mRNA processing and transport